MKIKVAFYKVVLASLFLFPALTWAGLPKERAAWDRGDYATVLRESTPLAEKGNAQAQYFVGMIYLYKSAVPTEKNVAFLGCVSQPNRGMPQRSPILASSTKRA